MMKRTMEAHLLRVRTCLLVRSNSQQYYRRSKRRSGSAVDVLRYFWTARISGKTGYALSVNWPGSSRKRTLTMAAKPRVMREDMDKGVRVTRGIGLTIGRIAMGVQTGKTKVQVARYALRKL